MGAASVAPFLGVDMSTVKFKKPSGVVMEVNDTPQNRQLAEAQGWKEVKSAPKKKAVKKAKK